MAGMYMEQSERLRETEGERATLRVRLASLEVCVAHDDVWWLWTRVGLSLACVG